MENVLKNSKKLQKVTKEDKINCKLKSKKGVVIGHRKGTVTQPNLYIL